MIRLYGICYNPLGMVMEFAGNGDLHDLLESLQKGKVNKDPYSLRTASLPAPHISPRLAARGLELTVIMRRMRQNRASTGCCP